MEEEDYIVTVLDYTNKNNNEYMYDFYKESRNWIFNNDNRDETIQWIKLDDISKKKILDDEIIKYFK